jgi:hypothetical protein
MTTQAPPGHDTRDLLAGDWCGLGERERRQALATARREGERAARGYLQGSRSGSLGPRPLCQSPWVREHPETHRLDGAHLWLYACAQTVPGEQEYVRAVIHRFGPEQTRRWWARQRAGRLADPRLCSFCDGYERERRRILGMDAPPIQEADLRRYLAEAKEHERKCGRAWHLCLVEAPEEESDTQRAIAQWEYRRSVLGTDLAQMLLMVAVYRSRDRVSGRCDRSDAVGRS